MTLTKYLTITKVNKKSQAIVKELEICPGDIIQVILPVANKRYGDTIHASKVTLKNWRNLKVMDTTLNKLGRMLEGDLNGDIIEYVEKETLV